MDNYGTNFRAPRADVHDFSMIPSASIPRSTFRMNQQHKTTINASVLTPIFVTEVLPGDTFNINVTAFCRMSTPIYPVMDNMELEYWFFFVPNRIVWQHWVNFMGEQPQSPADSISYTIPTVTSAAGGFTARTLYDYMGIPAGSAFTGNTYTINALPFRAYNMIWNQWFRDENQQTAVGYGATFTVYDIGDGPDPVTNYTLQNVNKRHDYFTGALPWTQKAANPVGIPLTGQATVKTSSTNLYTGVQNGLNLLLSTGGTPTNPSYAGIGGSGGAFEIGTSATGGAFSGTQGPTYPANLYADLTTATSTTINALRLAFQTQKLLERDARGGTRYTEIIRSHFGVNSPDMRLQRPEYLGGGKQSVTIAPVPQTTATGITGGSSALGTLAAVGTVVSRGGGMRQSFTEHGHVIGLATVRADQTYQNGVHRMWTRSTRYDFYFPAFAMLGEQAIRNDEIYAQGVPATDTAAFGYQERWAEMRYLPNRTSAAFRSTYATPLDSWHLAINFGALPALNSSFMADSTANILDRVLAAGATARTNSEQFICDFLFQIKAARPMPMYSVPGLIDHF